MSRVLPILFNTEMVRAILDGRKTVTRRICKDANEFTVPDMSFFDAEKRTYAVHNYADAEHTDKLSVAERTCPICLGDILYVRETWQHLYELDGNEQIIEGTEKYYYAATDIIPFDTYVDSSGITHDKTPWRPSIHMPKEAARIFLKVRDVRVERLQDIDDDGVVAEGLKIGGPFDELWDSTIKKADIDRYGWKTNPWVWVIEFEQCEKPEE